LNVAIRRITLAYERLARKAVELNESYLDLLKIYDEINDFPDLLPALAESGSSPFKVIAAMERDRQTLLDRFDSLATQISQAIPNFFNDPETAELQSIDHDRKVMRDFIESLDLKSLEQMFSKLNHH
jgi:hypothetical protein